MESLSDLISRTIAPEAARVLEPNIRRVEAPIPMKGTEPASAAYEIAVFNFFFAQKKALGITQLWKCKNSRIDGLVDLDDCRRLGLEVKYRMNWLKACQGNSQFSWFLNHAQPKAEPLSGALVVSRTSRATGLAPHLRGFSKTVGTTGTPTITMSKAFV